MYILVAHKNDRIALYSLSSCRDNSKFSFQSVLNRELVNWRSKTIIPLISPFLCGVSELFILWSTSARGEEPKQPD